jgi:flagellar assembly protein FliH
LSKLIKPDDERIFQSARKFEKDSFRLDRLSPAGNDIRDEAVEEGDRPEDHRPEPDTVDPVRLIAEAKEEAARILKEARNIIREAEASATRTIEDAKSRSQDIFRQARERGRADGAEEVRAQAERRHRARAEMISSFVEQMKKREAELLESLSPQLAEFAIELAEKIVNKKLEHDSQMATRQAERAIAKILERDKLLIRVNPSDEGAMKEHKAALIELFDGIDKIEVIADGNVERGGCVVETDLLKVDAQPHTQLEAARNVLADENQ